ncbi:2-succinyl-5-enolpyruvyl-6-hydroxy-3-cyclohexene-1-carboxylate synthase [Sanguibacter gelidistatuariae]|uniref:2-succinyl-5-enolpyruvyl-6-hydroxy-3-cyclohexene-1-carboxylate synthase n=1 Tax=Sanguibacter gelidistatuariae TaxID=1814289 RepID=A0A1G6X120_9MICO|nr:2-succinyl-5-enolpyruvyl-6-hydroxy-3-cyclohexene-1-carboxylic-acid synthase [Sanguibacter gelidistatuariae]SDD71818.1 2-succinyl-5-enolpyruvyl-6-hydroxy-3-cyclohexene-1-carboxylate synthase [Sanguibacter gelidistatuariae]
MTTSPSVAAARDLVRSLVRLGVRDVVLAPGSRSAPLAYAFAAAAGHTVPGGRSPLIRLHVRIDERDAGFLALGLAQAGQVLAGHLADPLTGRALAAPVAVVTTSGTAVANLLPAVLEAHHSGVPLLLLTADRPHELRGTGANQTGDQVGIFGSATRLAVDVPAPSGRPEELWDLRAVVTRAVAAASGTRTLHPGPVHLNLAYREPLAPGPEDLAGTAGLAGMDGLAGEVGVARRAHGADDEGPTGLGRGLGTVLPRTQPGTDPLIDELRLDAEPATVVVAGDGASPVARALAETRSWPLLAEASSGAAGGPNLIHAHRLVLGASDLTAQVRQVILLGRPTLSRPVQQLLARPDVRVVVVATGAEQWPDAARNASFVLDHVPAGWLTGSADPRSERALKKWRAASEAATDVVGQACGEAVGVLTALVVADAVARASAPGDALVIGSSSPVRDLDLVARWFEPPTVVANRGLAGIDGTISTAIGVALGLQGGSHGPGAQGAAGTVRALLGDLTFLHDVGGLLRGPFEPAVSLQIVVVNDDGGAIFAGLEHGRAGDPALFERVFATPHGADLGLLCAGYGVHHERVDDAQVLGELLAQPRPGISVVEVQVSRAARATQESDLLAALRKSL